jgi:2-keto-4-pentenoate hydratase/2-oxohepta-3-ene-1,7-dioic acid hydratase in catechol pathway
LRFVTFERAGTTRPGYLDGDCVRAIRCDSMLEYIALPAGEREKYHGTESFPLADVTLRAPVRPRKNIFCVGRNYLDHAKETADLAGRELKLPDVPTFFTKAPTAIAGPNQTLQFSAKVSREYDWEAELAIVIGSRIKDISPAEALQAVFGYTCFNDITARDLQRAHVQWFKGKSLDDAAPMGPWIVSAGEIGDAQALEIELRVNGTRKQHSNTSRMIFSLPAIVASLSKGMTLEPGDVIATGTPEGVGFARTPPEYLRDGDDVEVEIEKIGVLRNGIRVN